MLSKKIYSWFAIILLSFIHVPITLGGTSIDTIVTDIQVQDNRTYIYVSPEIGSATSCTRKDRVEVANVGNSNENPNRDLIMSIAISALISGKPVAVITSNQCSNTNTDIISGIWLIK